MASLDSKNEGTILLLLDTRCSSCQVVTLYFCQDNIAGGER